MNRNYNYNYNSHGHGHGNNGNSKDKGNRSVASPFGLRSGLRRSGRAFGSACFGTAEAVPLSKTRFFVSLRHPHRRLRNGWAS
jgi:hypothetical protein